MLKDVVEVRHAGGHRLFLRFEDGVQGILDFAGVLKFRGVFAPLRDQHAFAQAKVDAEVGTVVWPGGADLAPEVLYERLVAASDKALPPQSPSATRPPRGSSGVSERGGKSPSSQRGSAGTTTAVSSRSIRKRAATSAK